MSCHNFAKDPEKDCESVEDIDQMARQMSLDFFFKNNYFDREKYDENPITEVVDYQYMTVDPLRSRSTVFNIRENNVITKDSQLFDLFHISKYTFYTISRYYEYTRDRTLELYG
jgi:hypothetical protein